MKVNVCAKLNLTLDVFPKQEFHPIDSLALSVDICDTVEVTSRCDNAITLSGCPNIPLEQNAAYLAAKAFQHQFGTSGMDISVTKRIPVGAGMGGSSADAAAVVYCACKLFNIDTASSQVVSLCAQLGSDINFMLVGGLCRMTGKGDNLQKLVLPAPLYFAVTPFEPVSTKAVYEAFDSHIQPHFNNAQVYLDICNTLYSGGDVRSWNLRNNLQVAALHVGNFANDYLYFCNLHGLPATMTGSGSAFFIPCLTLSHAKEVCQLLNGGGFPQTFTCKSSSGILPL